MQFHLFVWKFLNKALIIIDSESPKSLKTRHVGSAWDLCNKVQLQTIRWAVMVVNRLVKNSQACYHQDPGTFNAPGFSFTFKTRLLYIKPRVEPQWFIAQNTGEFL